MKKLTLGTYTTKEIVEGVIGFIPLIFLLIYYYLLLTN